MDGDSEYARPSAEIDGILTGADRRPWEDDGPYICDLKASFSLLSSSFWYRRRSISSDFSELCSFCANSRFLRCSFLLRPGDDLLDTYALVQNEFT
jgi:hypothetical protein